MLKSMLIEFIGTLVFLFPIIETGNPILFSITLALAVYAGRALGHATANYNPAITIMMIAAKKQPVKDLVPYIIAQIAGGLSALYLHKLIHQRY